MTTTWTATNKSATPTWTPVQESVLQSYLLLETGNYILCEDGTKIVLEQSTPIHPTWTATNKS